MRKARITNTEPVELDRIEALLPNNYDVEQVGEGWVIIGEDDAGWTLDGYVIPRLASGLIFAVEIKNEIRFVTAYEVTRHYGGPEEGGWYYNWYDPIDTVPTSKPEEMVEEFKTRYEDRVQGDIYSVNGGTAVSVIIEDEPAGMKSTEIPHYE